MVGPLVQDGGLELLLVPADGVLADDGSALPDDELVNTVVDLRVNVVGAARQHNDAAAFPAGLRNDLGALVAQLGLKYVHNDTCYPALLVIGQFLDALNSGKYDLDHTALLITQTGGGCRASNYIKLLRKALVKAGYGNIPVASLNFSGLEKGSGLPLTVPLLRKVIASIFYGDMLVALRSQTHAYENHRGDADAMTEKWISTIQGWIRDDKNYSAHDMKRRFYDIAADYATIPITRVPKVKVGVVGEIYVKYSPLGNNDLEKFLESQDCEVNLPGLMGFVEYCVANYKLDIDLYGGNKLVAGGADAFLSCPRRPGAPCAPVRPAPRPAPGLSARPPAGSPPWQMPCGASAARLRLPRPRRRSVRGTVVHQAIP